MPLDFTPDDFVDLGIFDIIGDEITLMAWVNPDAYGSDPRIISRATTTATSDLFWTLLVQGGGGNLPEFRVFAGGSGTLFIGSTSLTPFIGTWFHLAGVYDGVDLKIYLNGVQDGGSTAKAGAIRTGGAPTWIGANPLTASDRPWDGEIEDARIYSRALSADEMLTIFNAEGVDGIADGLLTKHHMLEGAPGVAAVGAGTVKDAAGNHNGTPTGSPVYSASNLRFRRRA